MGASLERITVDLLDRYFSRFPAFRFNGGWRINLSGSRLAVNAGQQGVKTFAQGATFVIGGGDAHLKFLLPADLPAN
jgi:hypothetical protein